MEPTGEVKQKGGILRRQRGCGGEDQAWETGRSRAALEGQGQEARPLQHGGLVRPEHPTCAAGHGTVAACPAGRGCCLWRRCSPFLCHVALLQDELLGMSWWSRVFTAAGDGREGLAPGPCSGKQALILMTQKKDAGCWAANSKGVVSTGAFPVEKNMIEISALT